MRWTAVVLLLVAIGRADAKPPVPTKYHFELAEVTVAPSAPAELAVKAREAFDAVAAGRADMAPKLDGAPDPAKDPEGYRKVADAKGVKSYAIKMKIDDYSRSLEPVAPGKRAQMLKIALSVALVGAQLPGEALALAGRGGATVSQEVGATPRAGEEEALRDDALKAAVTQAVEDAVAKLQAPPPKTVPRKKHK
jgi:hypothetical protein